MKTKPIILILAVLFVYAIAPVEGSAQTDSPCRVKTTVTVCEKEPQKIAVMISNPDGEKLQVEVYSSENGYLFSKTVKVNEYRANLDFSTAVDGDYTIEVSCRNGEKIRKIISMQTSENITRQAKLKR